MFGGVLRVCVWALSLALLFYATGCAEGTTDQPTPDAAKRFLKLRGYEFDEESFFKAASQSDVMAVDGFISAGININAKDRNDDTALVAAASRGDAKIIELLLRRGADVNARGRNNWTAFLLALQEERSAVVDQFASHPRLDLTAETPERKTALILAVWAQYEPIVRTLLQRGVAVDHQDKDGDTAVHGAALYGNAKIMELLLDARANPNLKNRVGGTPLMWAAAYGHGEVVGILLNRGADPKLKDVDGITAAGWAGKNGHGDLELILRNAEKSK